MSIIKYDKIKNLALKSTIKSGFGNTKITFFHNSFAISLKSTTFAPSFRIVGIEF
jgi:hypothetical protein